MEFFRKTKAVKLRSHHGKYLVADDAGKPVRQSRDGSSVQAIWLVETVELNEIVIRLRSCHGEYLTASETPFLLGMTGKKVLQTTPESKGSSRVEWEPVRDGFLVKLKTMEGKFLRANGGPPPWRNSVTHDNPTSVTEDWILWHVESAEPYQSGMSFSSEDSSPVSSKTPSFSSTESGVEVSEQAEAVPVGSRHEEHVHANTHEKSVTHDIDGSSVRNARLAVGLVAGVLDVLSGMAELM